MCIAGFILGGILLKPSEILLEEIDVISCLLDVLECMHQRMLKKEPVNLNDLKKVIHYLKTLVHVCHNKKEQHILFPEFQKNGITLNTGILKELISENQLADFYISAMAKVLNDLMQGHADSESKMNTLIRKYLTLEKKPFKGLETFFCFADCGGVH